jgi:hypothetical protein
MAFGEIIFYIFISLIVISQIIKFFEDSDEDKEYKRLLNERLKDEYIYDPETGTKITLEEAESGHWINHNNLNRVKSQEEINKFFVGREKEAEELINHIKLKKYKFTKLTNSQLTFLDKTKIFEKYNDWSYSNSFSFDNGKNFIFLPAVKINSLHRYQDDYHESQIMFWIKIEKLSGHYYFREKTNFESFTDLIRNDDEIKLDDYECFSFKHSNNKINLIKLLKLIEIEKELEIEIIEENLLIKTLKFPNMEDFLRIENVIKNIC